MLSRKKLALLLPLLAACPAKERQAAEAPPAARQLHLHKIKVQVQIPARLSSARLAQGPLTTTVRQQLKAAAAVSLVRTSKPGQTYQLELRMGVGLDRDDIYPGDLVLLCWARAEIPDALEAVSLQSQALAPLSTKPDAKEVQAKGLKLLAGVLTEVLYQAELAVADEARLLRALAGKDPDRLAAAVEIVATRKPGGAVAPLARLLKHKEARVADRAIGALVALGDRSAVKHLTRMTRPDDTARLAKVLDAIAALGGKEARQYLEFVGTGHEDEDIRNMAKEALDRMQRRARSAGKKK